MTDPFIFNEAQIVKGLCSDVHSRQEMMSVFYRTPTNEHIGLVVQNIEVLVEEAINRMRYAFEHHFSGLSAHERLEILAQAQKEGGA